MLRHCPLLNLPVEKQNGHPEGDQKHSSVLQRIRANFQSMTSSSILYTFYFAIVAWLYSSIGVLFLSDSVPKLYNLFMTKCMWFTLMSGISLMCSRTPLWRTLQDCKLLYGLAKVLQRWSYMWREDKLHRFIVSHQEKVCLFLRSDTSKRT